MNRDINKLRKKIDRIDKQLMKKLDYRFQIVKQIGDIKKEKNLLITDSSREQQILDKAEQFATENEIKNIYGNIFKEAKNLQAKYLVLGNASYTYSSYIHQRFTNENYQIQETDDLKQFLTIYKPLGINISNPLKKQGFDVCQEISEKAKKSGVINLITKKNNQYYGDNIDIDAFLNMINYYKIDFTGKNIIIIGNGATSRSIISAISSLKPQSIFKLVREKRDINEIEISSMPFNLACDILIDATSNDVYPEFNNEPLIDINKILNVKYFITVNYNPNRSLLYQNAEKLKIKCYNGLMMLIENARISESIWNDKEIPFLYTKQIMKDLLNKLNIVLIGQTGSGKTTTSFDLSFITNKKHFDTDELIEKKTQLIVNDNINNLDEFRETETKIIKNLSLTTDSIISVGAGAILNPENMQNLKRNGILVFLNISLEKLIERFNEQRIERPLIKKIDDLKTMYQKRQQIYLDEADIIIDCDNLNSYEIAEKIEEKVYEYINHKWL